MRVGIMLRTIDEDQGIGIYTRNLVPRLLEHGPDLEFVLLFRTPRFMGRFAGRPNVREALVKGSNTALWDQVGVPRAAREHSLDLVFHPKFTVPLLTRRPTVMVLHGPDQFRNPENYSKLDVAYLRAFMPHYCRRARHLISNSRFTTDEFVRLFDVPRAKITTIPFAAGDHFAPVTDAPTLQRVREKYGLPPRFLLSVTKYFRGKNVPRLIGAWSRLREDLRSPLVLVGRDVDRFLDDTGLRGTGLAGEIVCPGWVDQEDLPAIYSLASLFVFPSLEESFGIPVVEAMRCNCAVVASRVGAIPELTGDAAVLVDPEDEDELRGAMEGVLSDESVRDRMRRTGLELAARFTWREHALRTLEVLRSCLDRPAAPRLDG